MINTPVALLLKARRSLPLDTSPRRRHSLRVRVSVPGPQGGDDTEAAF